MSDAVSGPRLSGRRVSDTEPALVAFLKGRVNTFVKWDLVHFFHANPNTADTADNIARYAGRSPEVVATELQELAADGLLAAQTLGGLAVYRLTDDPDTRALLARFVEACADRQFRLGAIYTLVRSTQE